ncbi:MRTO4 [Cordylochernes scorpioides]|uniref:Ribosome assembly factor mrt4 n=1 Tax=Cordylochernes scorpioides TaxID=51811 RepID=A0ABY6LSA7_9ARAC|nr:MRTO4 [Cordylochernes scorpioides]
MHVSLTQTSKKGLENKQKLISEIQDNMDQYSRIFVFKVYNSTASYLHNVRVELKPSRILMGKRRVMAKALMTREELEPLARHLDGLPCGGILLTNKTKDEIIEYFQSQKRREFAQSGTKAPETIVLQPGPLPQLSHAIEPYLVGLKVPTQLKRGVVHLAKEYTVCTEGEPITPTAARLLKLLDMKLGQVQVKLLAMWCSKDGYVELALPEDSDEEEPLAEELEMDDPLDDEE